MASPYRQRVGHPFRARRKINQTKDKERKKYRMSTKLFVGNLSYSITEQELRDAFSQSGRTVQSVRIAVDRETQRPRGFAFVEVATDQDAESAINEWNNKMLSGRTVFVE